MVATVLPLVKNTTSTEQGKTRRVCTWTRPGWVTLNTPRASRGGAASPCSWGPSPHRLCPAGPWSTCWELRCLPRAFYSPGTPQTLCSCKGIQPPDDFLQECCPHVSDEDTEAQHTSVPGPGRGCSRQSRGFPAGGLGRGLITVAGTAHPEQRPSAFRARAARAPAAGHGPRTAPFSWEKSTRVQAGALLRCCGLCPPHAPSANNAAPPPPKGTLPALLVRVRWRSELGGSSVGRPGGLSLLDRGPRPPPHVLSSGVPRRSWRTPRRTTPTTAT